MNKFLIIILLSITFVGCSSGKKYRVIDYAHACVNNYDKELGKTVTDVCLPIDTYVNDVRFHRLKPYQKIKMPTMRDAMRYNE